MILSLTAQFDSLSPFESLDLPDFTVITGKNGSGKTQLLEGIYQKKIICVENGQRLEELSIQLNNVEAVQTAYQGDPEQYFRNEYTSGFTLGDPVYDALPKFIISNNLLEESQNLERTDLLSNQQEYRNILSMLFQSNNLAYEGNPPYTSPFDIEVEKKFIELYLTADNIEKFKKVVEIESFGETERKAFSKMFRDLSPRDTPPFTLFTLQLESIFNEYARRRYWNAIHFAQNVKYGEHTLAVSDEQFLQNNPAPWQELNTVLDRNDLDFEFKEFGIWDYGDNPLQKVVLKKQSDQKVIGFENLSSGEKIVLGLVLRLFMINTYRANIVFPGLLLLDEPDAHLHPQMTQLMLSVLFKSFVTDFKIKVILTTHSATTVALSPPNNIFEIKNGTPTSLQQVGKDKALQILTGFLPTLSIDYKNHRQVYVESPTDADYFVAIYNHHRAMIPLSHKLYFIKLGEGKMNSDKVYKNVGALRESGNTTAFGIIDRDEDNPETDCVFVHGADERYSLESYLFDPIYVVTHLIAKNHESIGKDLIIPDGFSWEDIKNQPQEILQGLVDQFLTMFCRANPYHRQDDPRRTVKYYNNTKNIEINLPQKYLNLNGHKQLLVQLNKAFPTIFPDKDDKQFNREFIELIAACYPLVPTASINIIEKIALRKHQPGFEIVQFL